MNDFKSLYRIVLKSSYCSVLYSRPSTKQIKTLYRNEFEYWINDYMKAKRKKDKLVIFNTFKQRGALYL